MLERSQHRRHPQANKPDYTNPKAYRPIAILNCLGKVLEKLMGL